MSTGIVMKTKRTYVMRARAEATTQTRRRILQAAFDLSMEKMAVEIVLDDVAARASVSVQTILRHFGSRDGLFDAAEEFAMGAIREERAATPGDVPAAVRILYDHYERRGDAVLTMLAQEQWDERTRRVNEQGRRLHRDWVRQVFVPWLDERPDAEETVDLLVVATDVYAWKLLRRDRGLSREQTKSRIRTLVGALLTSTP
jgi:AcrR family transcriptional regulator